MNKIILTKGLPASGKSTWSRQYQVDHPGTVRVNKDDLRAMLHNGKWSDANEKFVLKLRNFIVEESLKAGHDVIIDDTNLHSKHKNEMWKIGAAHNATVEEKSFLDVSIEECIKRDLKRPNSVGEKVIRNMYNQFLKPVPVPVEINPGVPSAIICDIDGTLALFGDKNPYDRDFENDQVNKSVVNILQIYHLHDITVKIILVSGRQEKSRTVTEDWLLTNGIPHDILFMRKTDDVRKDNIIKSEIYEAEIKNKYNVLFVLDDRNQVVEFWRSLGLTCLQVAEGDF
jgi:predicted kinase